MNIDTTPSTNTGWMIWFWDIMGFEIWNTSEYVLFGILCVAVLFGAALIIALFLFVKKYIELRYAPFYVGLRSEHEKTLKKKE